VARSAHPRGTGFDFAGDVVEVADDVQRFRAGDAVWGFLNGIRQGPVAATAEYVLAPVTGVARRPRNIDEASAAALAGAGGAALAAVRDHGKVRQGERVLVRGAGGGVGVAAVQIARAMGGHVVATVRESHLARAREIGAHEAFDYRSTDASSLGEFDVIIDSVATDLRSFRRLLRPGGRMLAITIGGFWEAMTWITSVVFGGRRIRFVQAPPGHDLLTGLTDLVEADQVSPVVERSFALAEIADAHRAFDARGSFGKLVVTSR